MCIHPAPWKNQKWNHEQKPISRVRLLSRHKSEQRQRIVTYLRKFCKLGEPPAPARTVRAFLKVGEVVRVDGRLEWGILGMGEPGILNCPSVGLLLPRWGVEQNANLRRMFGVRNEKRLSDFCTRLWNIPSGLGLGVLRGIWKSLLERRTPSVIPQLWQLDKRCSGTSFMVSIMLHDSDFRSSELFKGLSNENSENVSCGVLYSSLLEELIVLSWDMGVVAESVVSESLSLFLKENEGIGFHFDSCRFLYKV